jgi:hypothetical protein
MIVILSIECSQSKTNRSHAGSSVKETLTKTGNR